MIENMTDSAGADSDGHVLNANRVLSEDATHFLLLKRDPSQSDSQSSQTMQISTVAAVSCETKSDTATHEENHLQFNQAPLSTEPQASKAANKLNLAPTSKTVTTSASTEATAVVVSSAAVTTNETELERSLNIPKPTGVTPVARRTRSKTNSRPTSPTFVKFNEEKTPNVILSNSNEVREKVEEVRTSESFVKEVKSAATKQSEDKVQAAKIVNLEPEHAQTVRKLSSVEPNNQKSSDNEDHSTDLFVEKAPVQQTITVNIQTQNKLSADDLFPADMFSSQAADREIVLSNVIPEVPKVIWPEPPKSSKLFLYP